MSNPVRTTLTARSRRNVAIVAASAGLAVLGLGGGAAVALTTGDDPADPQPPELATTQSDDTQPPRDDSQPPPDGSQPPRDDIQPPPDDIQPPPDNAQPPPDDTQATSPNLPSVETACTGEDAGELVAEPKAGTLEDGRPFVGYPLNIDGVLVVAMDVGRDGVIDVVVADGNGDGESDAAASCGTDAEWQPIEA